MRVDAAAAPTEQLRRIVRGLRNGLTLQDNLQCVILDIADSGPANTAIAISHDLGKIPIVYIWNIDRAGIVYDSNKAGWDTDSMELKCSVANAVLKLIVF